MEIQYEYNSEKRRAYVVLSEIAAVNYTGSQVILKNGWIYDCVSNIRAIVDALKTIYFREDLV